jgi:hypothetical protein
VIAFLCPLTVFVTVILASLIFPGGGYKRRPLDAPSGQDWTFTGERFLDPSSGELVEVWSRPRNGERAYVRARSG